MGFIFSSFWTWAGTVILLVIVFDGVENVLGVLRRHRKVRVSQTGKTIVVEIENATTSDVDTALADVEQNRRENTADD